MSRSRLACVTILGTALSIATSIATPSAHANLIANGSFTPSDYVAPGYITAPGFPSYIPTSTLPGWTATGGAGASAYAPGSGFWDNGAVSGQGQSGYVGFAQGLGSSLSQSLDFVGGTQYALTFDYNARVFDPNALNRALAVYIDGFNALADVFITPVGDNGSFYTASYTFFAPATTTDKITFLNFGSSDDQTVLFANAKLEAIPEPASIAMLAFALLCAGYLAKRRGA